MDYKQFYSNNLLKDKKIIVTGCSSGIGKETSKLIKKMGGEVLGVDVNKTDDYIDELYLADLSDRRTIKSLILISCERCRIAMI